MIEQIGNSLPFTAFYTTLGLGTTGLTVTVDVFRNGAIIVTGASAAEAGDGLYTYTLASGSNTVEGIYVAVFKTATVTVDQQHLVAGWTVGKAGVENLDALITSRIAPTVAGRTLDVSVSGEAGLDWANIGSPSTAQTLSGTVINDVTLVETYLSVFVAQEATLTAAEANITADIAAIPTAPTVGQIDTQLSGTHGAGAWGAGIGTGEISYTPERITDPSHNPIDGVQVWVTTDEPGVNVQARGYTNAFGYLPTPFMLDAGTYYLWRQHGRYEWTNPKTVVVS